MVKLSVNQALLKANSLAKKNEFGEAQNLYQMVLQTSPKNKRAQRGLAALNKLKVSNDLQGPPQETINQLISLYKKGQMAEVVEQATSLTAQYPEAFIVWNILGIANKGLEKLPEAIASYKTALSLKPDYAGAHNNLGVALKGQDKLDEAVASYTAALSLNPKLIDAWINMGNALQKQGKFGKAIEAYTKALSLNPGYAAAHNNMGVAFKKQGRLPAAIASFEKAISLNPVYVDAHNNMGLALQDQGKLQEAMEALNKALAIKPDYVDALNNMGVALQDQGKLDEAIEALNKALIIKPDYAEAYLNKGNALKDQGKVDDAMEAYNKALASRPDYAEAYNNIGNVFKDQGEVDEAIDAYNKALALKPDSAESHRNIGLLIRYDADHPQIDVVRELMKRSDLRDEDRCNLHYALAKMSEDLGELDVAFENYVAGGRLRQKLLSFDFKKVERGFYRIKAIAPTIKDILLSEPFEAAHHTPIFILGMPRSGTTLVEQIISSHSHVHGAGELSFLGQLASPLINNNRVISSKSIFQFREAYLKKLGKVSNGSPFVTDKMPQNFLHVGLILKAFPESKVVHVQRDPAATCWSNFKHYFSSKGLGFSYDLKDTLGYFKLYKDLMHFWDDDYVDQIYHLDYDRLTVEQEPETRRLIEYLGLEWEDACLSPHANKRNVRTASQQQVREKVYTGSSNAWLKFEPYLKGVFDELKP